MRRLWRLTLSSALLLALPLLLAACGSQPPTATPAPTPTPFNTEELRSLVQDAVAQAMPQESSEPAITEEQLRALVERAVADSVSPGLTPADVEKLVQAAVKSAMTSGVTLTEVEEAIAAALAAESDRTSQISQPPPSEPLVIYSGRSESLVDAVIQQFSQATGIGVEVKYAGTSQLAATLLEEGGNSPADIFFAQDPGGLGAVRRDDVHTARPYSQPGAGLGPFSAGQVGRAVGPRPHGSLQPRSESARTNCPTTFGTS